MQNPVRHETLHGAEAQVQHCLVPAHGLGEELHGLLFDVVRHRLLDRDVCWLQLRQYDEHVTLWMSSTDPVRQGSLPVDRGAVPQQHPVQEPLCSHPGAKPFDQLLARALGAPVAPAEGVGNLVVLWEVLYHSFRGALHSELGHDGACHGHDRRDREISLVSGADEAHPSVLLRSRTATVSQAKSFAAVSSMLMMQDGCTPYSVTQYSNRSSSTCVSTSLGFVVFLVPLDAARYFEARAAEEMADPPLAESACRATLLGHSVEDGLHHTRADREACLANTVALISQNGNDHIASSRAVATVTSCTSTRAVACMAKKKNKKITPSAVPPSHRSWS